MRNKNIHFIRMLQICQNYDSRRVMREIYKIKNSDFREKMINEAKEYYAHKYGCSKSEVCYGDWVLKEDFGVCPYVVVVGDVVAKRKQVDFPILRVVLGDMDCSESKVKDCSKLSYVQNDAKFFKSSIKSLQSFNKCGGVADLSYSRIKYLALKTAGAVDLFGTSIKKIELKMVKSWLNIENSAVEDISSLNFVCNLEMEDVNNVQKFNPGMVVQHIEGNKEFEQRFNKARQELSKE